MKVLLVNGSPHKGGCTHTALQLVGDALQSRSRCGRGGARSARPPHVD